MRFTETIFRSGRANIKKGKNSNDSFISRCINAFSKFSDHKIPNTLKRKNNNNIKADFEAKSS
jgi:hypothetical protein